MSGITEQQFLVRPSKGRWSIGECLEHLNITNRLLLREMEEPLRKARTLGWMANEPYELGWFARRFVASLEPPIKYKAKAVKTIAPSCDVKLERCQEEWDKTHAEVEQIVLTVDGLDLRKMKVRSPVSKWIKYNLGTALAVIAAHDRRHLWQAEQVREALAYPKIRVGLAG
ncbi:MAG TPA: DinB family protein [Bryobacteraceae bacterium]|nr:DinB family protein [Bryobacteraceae bacterium]